ncbi:MAG: universal stress protein [Thermodesulfovibrionales bacterium]
MFERVLTATDMLGACDSAVVTALEIAKKDQGRLFVLHVLEPSYFHECGPLESIKDFKTGEETVTSQEYKERVKQELDNKCGGALKPYGNYQIDISYGRPGIEIRKWARKIGADLIVLGPHAGKIEEEQELIGSPIGDTVEDVIMYATYPTMIVNRLIPKERLHFKKIMVCIDFSKSCEYAVEFAVKLARKYDSKLLLFYMLSTSQSGKNESEVDIASFNEKLRDFCKIPEEIKNEYSIWKGSRPYLEILKYSHEKDVDLIVMGSHTTGDDKRWYVGSTVEEVTAQCLCPVVVVTHPELFPKIKK